MELKLLIIPSIILLVGVADDLLSKKVPNSHVIAMAAIAIISAIYFNGVDGILPASLAFFTAFVVMIPLVMARVVGAGDMKLLMAFGLSVSWSAVFVTAISALIWGALLGVLQAILSGKFSQLLKTTRAIAGGAKQEAIETTQIPYTVALFFGWLTYLSLEVHGGRI